MKVRQVGEFGLIDIIKDNTLVDPSSVVAGIGDDTAVLKHPSGKLLLATTDMMIENIHFIISGDNGRQIGYRVMAANVSDIASMGGRPTHAIISIGVHPDMEVSFVESVYEGMNACSRDYGVNIVGGDTVTSPDNLVLNVALLGLVDPDKYLPRSGARPGDLVMVTNVLGDSRAGLDIVLGRCSISQEGEKYLLDRHYYSNPRVEEMAAGTACGGITAADDISDGLGSEIHEIADASGVGAILKFEDLPVSDYTREVAEKTNTDLIEYCLFGGEDFEVVITVDPRKADALAEAVESATGTKLTVVGEIVDKSEGVKLLRNNSLHVLPKKGYSHFKK